MRFAVSTACDQAIQVLSVPQQHGGDDQQDHLVLQSADQGGEPDQAMEHDTELAAHIFRLLVINQNHFHPAMLAYNFNIWRQVWLETRSLDLAASQTAVL